MIEASGKSRFARWMTPRFPIEMAVASLGTFAIMLALGGLGRTTNDAKLVKLTVRPAPVDRPYLDHDDAASAGFIERFALAHVAPPLPESAIVSPQPRAEASAAPHAPGLVLTHDRIRAAEATSSVASPPRRATELAQSDSVPAPAAPPEPKAPEFRIPLVSDAVANLGARLPSGRDMLDGVGTLARRVGGLLSGTSRS